MSKRIHYIANFFNERHGCKKSRRPFNAFRRLLLFAFGLGIAIGRATGAPIAPSGKFRCCQSKSRVLESGKRTISFARVIRRSSGRRFIDARAPPHVHDPPT